MPTVSSLEALLGVVSSLSTQLRSVAEILQCKYILTNSYMILMQTLAKWLQKYKCYALFLIVLIINRTAHNKFLCKSDLVISSHYKLQKIHQWCERGGYQNFGLPTIPQTDTEASMKILYCCFIEFSALFLFKTVNISL
jgi:hypothetical protein